MHDAAWAERNGLPAVVVLSDAFVPQAKFNAAALGQAEIAHVTVPHPIQCNTDKAIVAKAEAVMPYVLAALTDTTTPAQPAAKRARTTAAGCET